MIEFVRLIAGIGTLHTRLQSHAANAVNQALTIRNWLIGFYIVEFELHGKNRASYGESLIDKMAQNLNHIKGLDRRSLFRFRTFYMLYPQVLEFLKSESNSFLQVLEGLEGIEKLGVAIPTEERDAIVGTLSPLLQTEFQIPGEKLISKLSYSHLELLLPIDNQIKRTFYELEAIKGTWSIRELKRQIGSQLFERSGAVNFPKKTLSMEIISPKEPTDIIKNIYAFDFLNLNPVELTQESDLEEALIHHLQEFILELGYGFCFESRQRRILIGERYYFVDLVFYHRILKCHVLVELKIGQFEYGDLGQLNTYVNFFKEEIREPTDNLPIGILLVAGKDKALVKYATGGMDKNLFIQEYMIQLPEKEKLEGYLLSELKKLN
jgi:predicted nuclease of restriction endonuclease-like (RecB) superfamily